MPYRFRRSIKLAPGLRVNVGKRGASLSLGGRGASLNIGRRGVHANVGLPGTGPSYRTRIAGGTSRSATRSSRYPTNGTTIEVKLSLQDDGSVVITDQNGQQLSPNMVKLMREQQGEFIQGWLKEHCDEINRDIRELTRIHMTSPAPEKEPQYVAKLFEESMPVEPALRKLGIGAKLFAGMWKKIEDANRAAHENFEKTLREWEERKVRFEADEAERRRLFLEARTGGPEGMQEYLEYHLKEISWPRETLIAFQASSDGQTVLLDVDLPEIEDMPSRQATMPSKGMRLNIKELTETDNRRHYMLHIHGVLFRIIAEVFSSFPNVQTVIVSGYSQRPNKATGNIEDEYLLSTKANRDDWKRINFNNLYAVDPAEAIGSLNTKRKMTKTGIFTPIEPFTAED